jgi:hypothetical protein
VVVIAMVQKGKTSLTTDEKYIYTEYGMPNVRVVADPGGRSGFARKTITSET